jgi:hypothetical protein
VFDGFDEELMCWLGFGVVQAWVGHFVT